MYAEKNITVSFSQSLYFINQSDLTVQTVVVLSNPSSYRIDGKVEANENDCGK